MGIFDAVSRALTKERTLSDVTSGRMFKGGIDVNSHLKQLRAEYTGTSQSIVNKIRNRYLLGKSELDQVFKVDKETLDQMENLQEWVKFFENKELAYINDLRTIRKERAVFIDKVLQKRIIDFRNAEAEKRSVYEIQAIIAGGKTVGKTIIFLGGVLPAAVIGAIAFTAAQTAKTILEGAEHLFNYELKGSIKDVLWRSLSLHHKVNKAILDDSRFASVISQLDYDLKNLQRQYNDSIKKQLINLGTTIISPVVGAYAGIIAWRKLVGQLLFNVQMTYDLITLQGVLFTAEEEAEWITFEQRELATVLAIIDEHLEVGLSMGNLQTNKPEYNAKRVVRRVEKVLVSREELA